MKSMEHKKPFKGITYSDCHNGFPFDLNDHKNKWSHHRSFLYGYDRPPEMHVLKLGTEILNLNHDWSAKLI